MKKHTLIAAAVAAMALAAPTMASASWNISQREAKFNALDAAEYKYAGYGVEAQAARCRPQGSPSPKDWIYRTYSGYYHRWFCIWVGHDSDGADVAGDFRITGHTNGNYGYLPVMGGLTWL